jgi:hypothetical protein
MTTVERNELIQNFLGKQSKGIKYQYHNCWNLLMEALTKFDNLHDVGRNFTYQHWCDELDHLTSLYGNPMETFIKLSDAIEWYNNFSKVEVEDTFVSVNEIKVILIGHGIPQSKIHLIISQIHAK